MTAPVQENQVQEQKPNDKEYNFRAFEQKMNRQLEQERQARMESERRLQELEKMRTQQPEVEEETDEPYVDHKRLNKTLSSFEKKMEEKIERKAEERARFLLDKQKQDMWMKQNADFYDVMQHAERFAQHDPELAESILEMPESFERQKLVYKNIKALGLHKAPAPEPSIQEKIDANKRSPFYQPTSQSSAPYANGGDYSKAGQKSAYDKMQELKSRLRL